MNNRVKIALLVILLLATVTFGTAAAMILVGNDNQPEYKSEDLSASLKDVEYVEPDEQSAPENTNNVSTTETPSTLVSVPTAKQETTKRIIVGDSREVGMYITEFGGYTDGTIITTDSNGDDWVSKGGMGLTWMEGQESTIEADIILGCSIIVNMGTNDAYSTSSSAARYVEYLNEMAPIWKSMGASHVYFMSTNPVDDSGAANWTALRNSHVVAFNADVKAGLSADVEYLDCYAYLSSIGWAAASGDGVHYTAATYEDIYDYIMEQTQYI